MAGSRLALANPLGALTFGLVRSRALPKVACSFLLLSVGFFVIALLPGWPSAVVGAVIANDGAGMILPTDYLGDLDAARGAARHRHGSVDGGEFSRS